jgi:hypothetical protein
LKNTHQRAASAKAMLSLEIQQRLTNTPHRKLKHAEALYGRDQDA